MYKARAGVAPIFLHAPNQSLGAVLAADYLPQRKEVHFQREASLLTVLLFVEKTCPYCTEERQLLQQK